MKTTIYKILGKRGRITIPFEIRQELGFAYNDVVSFVADGDTVLVRREKICDGCGKAASAPPLETTGSTGALINELVDGMTAEELRTVIIHLSEKWAHMRKAGGDGK